MSEQINCAFCPATAEAFVSPRPEEEYVATPLGWAESAKYGYACPACTPAMREAIGHASTFPYMAVNERSA